MEDLRLVDQGKIQFVRAELSVRAGLSRKAEGTVALLVEGDKSKGRKYRVVHHEAGGPDPGTFQSAEQHPAESIVPDLSEERAVMAEFFQRRQEICRGTACMGGHGGIAVLILTDGRKIYQKLTERSNFDHNESSCIVIVNQLF